MRKLKLDLLELEVESFDAANAARPAYGTVEAHRFEPLNDDDPDDPTNALVCASGGPCSGMSCTYCAETGDPEYLTAVEGGC